MYERLIQREDHHGNLLRAIEAIIPTAGLDIVDLGAGTGRLGRLLGPKARSLWALDGSAAMLRVAAQSFRSAGLDNCQAQVADHRQLPIAVASADLVVSGWSFSYLSVWGDRSQLEAGWSEIVRILRPGGMVILIESLGTGHPAPIRLDHLNDYYTWLAQKGCDFRQITTDYRFESLAEARELLGFFFGEQLAAEVESTTLPEFSGLWWKKTGAG